MSEKQPRTETNQDKLLVDLQKNRRDCTVITTNGVPIKGIVEVFDRYVILVRLHTGKQSLIYKHAVSTIIG